MAAALVRISVIVSVLALLATWASKPQGQQWPAGVRFTNGLPTQNAAPAADAARQSSVSRDATRTLRPAVPTTVMTPPPPWGSTSVSPGPVCHVSYSVAVDGPAQFVVVLVVANTGREPVNGWVLQWAFPASQRILYGWNAMVSIGSGGAVAANIGSNRTILPGGAVTLGFIGARGSWIPTPTAFSLNGNTCLWQPTDDLPLPNASPTLPAQSPSSDPTTPSSSPTPTDSATPSSSATPSTGAGQGQSQGQGASAAVKHANDQASDK